MVRAIFPLAAVGVATIAQEQQWGLFYLISLAPWQTIVLSIIFLDFATYLQHILFHTLPILWRFHKIHHADLDFDVTTGLRFHPVEILLSMVGKATVVLLLGAPAIAVLIFELILNATSMFNHGNVRLPSKLDPVLRLGVVTPDMHRIHHSSWVAETNSNFGFNIPWWDRLFGTYRASPSVSHKEMSIGLQNYQQDYRVAKLPWMLILPFVKATDYPSQLKKTSN
ncbi:MAG: sterol desaturase family protein [Cyanobacteria bacterium J06627_3]